MSSPTIAISNISCLLASSIAVKLAGPSSCQNLISDSYRVPVSRMSLTPPLAALTSLLRREMMSSKDNDKLFSHRPIQNSYTNPPTLIQLSRLPFQLSPRSLSTIQSFSNASRLRSVKTQSGAKPWLTEILTSLPKMAWSSIKAFFLFPPPCALTFYTPATMLSLQVIQDEHVHWRLFNVTIRGQVYKLMFVTMSKHVTPAPVSKLLGINLMGYYSLWNFLIDRGSLSRWISL